MGCSPLRAGLVALALVSALGAAEAKDKKGDTLPTLGEVESSPREVARIRQFLAADTNLTKMKLPRLQQRASTGPRARARNGHGSTLQLQLRHRVQGWLPTARAHTRTLAVAIARSSSRHGE